MNKYNSKAFLIFSYIAWFSVSSTSAFAQGEPSTVGDLITNTYVNMQSMPGFIVAIAYISGLLLAFNSILDFKKHVDNPQQAPLKVAYTKFIGAGGLLALPYMSSVVVNTLFNEGGEQVIATGRNAAAVGEEVDGMIYNFIVDIHGPMMTLITAFAYVSAIIFLIIGINKLVKMSSEGFKGVPPMSVIGNFVVAGALFAFGDMAGSFSSSLFGDASVKTYSVISSDVLSNAEDAERIATVIDAVMAFVALVGFIAFIRGWFVLRDVSEGGGKANLSQAIVFLIAGTIAINLGEFINIVQQTIGVDPANTLAFQ